MFDTLLFTSVLSNLEHGLVTLTESLVHYNLNYTTIPYPEIVPLSALIACNAMNSPGCAALSFSHRFHH